jgi:16S rRNA processing protein RimM
VENSKLKVVYLSDNHQPYKIEHVRPYKGDNIILKLADIDDATAAESLRNQSLLIPADQLAKLPPDSYYQHDILGLLVKTLEQRDLGPIVEIMETGSNDVYVLKGPDGKQIMIPAIKSVVKQIDLVNKVVWIEPLPGLLEPAEPEEPDEPAE